MSRTPQFVCKLINQNFRLWKRIRSWGATVILEEVHNKKSSRSRHFLLWKVFHKTGNIMSFHENVCNRVGGWKESEDAAQRRSQCSRHQHFRRADLFIYIQSFSQDIFLFATEVYWQDRVQFSLDKMDESEMSRSRKLHPMQSTLSCQSLSLPSATKRCTDHIITHFLMVCW